MNRCCATSLLLASALILGGAERGAAQEGSDSSASTRSGMFIAPFVVYSPETSWMFGVGGAGYFRSSRDTTVKPSTYGASFQASINGQYIIDPDIRLYLDEGRTFLWGRFRFVKSFEKYYGIGNETPEIVDPLYEMRRVQIRIESLRLVPGALWFGPVGEAAWEEMSDPRSNPMLLAGEAPGQDLTRTIGLGLVTGYDGRDNVYFPTGGSLGKLSYITYLEWLGSEAKFNWFEADLRHYVGLGPDRVLAFQLYGEFTSGEVPFFRLPALGGHERMRGYFRGRYRDYTSFAAQAEFRSELFWRIGAVAFVGAGEVAPTAWKLSLPGFHYSAGLGLRYLVDVEAKLHVRADYGIGEGSYGIYLTVEEAF
jgi:hypothetical protein